LKPQERNQAKDEFMGFQQEKVKAQAHELADKIAVKLTSHEIQIKIQSIYQLKSFQAKKINHGTSSRACRQENIQGVSLRVFRRKIKRRYELTSCQTKTQSR
jgi:hypothetical protein